MSLTEDITSLVSRATALIDAFNNKKAAIDAAVADAVAAVPAMNRTVYLDQIGGSDANDGAAEASAVRTMSRAVALIGAGRAGMVMLMADYTFDVPRLALPPNITLHIRSTKPAVRKIKLPVLPSLDQTSYQQEVAGFFAPEYGRVEVTLYRVNLEFPAAPVGGGVLAPSRYSSFLGSHLSVGPTSLSVAVSTAEIIRPAGGVGVLIGAMEQRPTHIGLQVATYPAEMAGNWIAGVAAGTAASGLRWLNTTLNTL